MARLRLRLRWHEQWWWRPWSRSHRPPLALRRCLCGQHVGVPRWPWWWRRWRFITLVDDFPWLLTLNHYLAMPHWRSPHHEWHPRVATNLDQRHDFSTARSGAVPRIGSEFSRQRAAGQAAPPTDTAHHVDGLFLRACHGARAVLDCLLLGGRRLSRDCFGMVQ